MTPDARREERYVTFVGESNPYGGNPVYALYPEPHGCTGWRLCHLILKMDPGVYRDTYGRANLVRGAWSMPRAREAAAALRATGHRFVLLGAKVAAAFGHRFEPFTTPVTTELILPHPSGLNRMWAEPGMFDRAREAVERFIGGEVRDAE
jgi:hypothetical protein